MQTNALPPLADDDLVDLANDIGFSTAAPAPNPAGAKRGREIPLPPSRRRAASAIAARGRRGGVAARYLIDREENTKADRPATPANRRIVRTISLLPNDWRAYWGLGI
jgi:hypothetical protein